MSVVSRWLPKLLGPHEVTQDGGTAVTARETWDFIGVTVADDEANEKTTFTVTDATVDPTAPLANASTGTLNDVTTTGYSGVRHSGAAPTVTGYASGAAGRRLLLTTTGGPLILANESASSVAANRIVTGTGANVTIANGAGCELVYDATSSRWRLVGDGAQAVPTTAVSAMAIDWSLSGTFSKTLAAGANTFTFSNATDGQCIIVKVTGAASTLTWPTVLWAGGVAPTQTASGVDIYTFVKIGSDIFGSVVQAMA